MKKNSYLTPFLFIKAKVTNITAEGKKFFFLNNDDFHQLIVQYVDLCDHRSELWKLIETLCKLFILLRKKKIIQ